MGEWKVAGRSFRNHRDYELAKRDAEYIDQIRRRYKLDKREEVERLLGDLQSGKYRFRTILEQDFEEEIQELLIGAKLAEKNQRNKTKKQKIQGKKSAQKTLPQKVRLQDYDKNMQKSILAEIKKRERNRRLVIFTCVTISLLCFGYLGYDYVHANRTEQKSQSLSELKQHEPAIGSPSSEVKVNHEDGSEEVLEVLDEYKTLYNLNKRLIGWIKIDDTNIDYPVLQTENNEYYLKHNFNQEEDKNGSIFLDKDCDILNRNTNLIIYGHHMSSGNMFGKLDKYTSKDYYKEHKYIQFDTIYEKGTYEIMYVFRSRIYEESEIVFKYYQFLDVNSEAEFNSYMAEMAEMSLYDTGITAQYGDELITLSTCDYYTSYGRFVVVAKRVS